MAADKQRITDPLINSLREKREHLMNGGGADAIAKQHGQGKLTARERVATLTDAGSFHEFGLFATGRQTQTGGGERPAAADGVITGAATVDGRSVHLAAQDLTVLGGTAGEVHCLKIAETMQRSLKVGSPYIFFAESGGARIQEGIDAMSGFGRVFRAGVLLSGAVPQISIVCGPCAGGAAISTALTDFVIQTRAAQMFVYGPPVIKQATGAEITPEELGGAEIHAQRSGVAHFVAANDQEAIGICRRLLSFLPSNHSQPPPRTSGNHSTAPNAALNDMIPVDLNQPYDVRDVITGITDDGDFLEVQSRYAANLVIGFARLAGRSVGIVANQPSVLGGAMDISAAAKAARFVRFCDAFNIPIIALVDTSGLVSSVEQEQQGIVGSVAQFVYAVSAATVPKIQVILRKSYGVGHVAMCSKELGADRVFAWPTAEIALIDADHAVEILYRKQLQTADDKAARRIELIDEYRATHASPLVAAGRRMVDDVIEPAETRHHLAQSLEYLQNMRQYQPLNKHGPIPL